MRRRRPVVRVLSGALLALVVVAFLSSVQVAAGTERFPCAKEDERSAASPEPAQKEIGTETGQFAPDFTLPDLDGDELSLAELRGCVLIIEFWASWCPPCWQSAVHLDELSQRYEDEGLVVIGISLDQSLGAIEGFLEATGEPDITVLWGSYSAAVEVAEEYGVRGIPQALVVDREGVIRYSGHPGLITSDTLAPVW